MANGADDSSRQVLRDLENQAVALVVGLQRCEDRRQLAFESDVDDGADDLRDLADQIPGGRCDGSGRGGCSLFGFGLGGAAVAMV
jgi:hypothetical protein